LTVNTDKKGNEVRRCKHNHVQKKSCAERQYKIPTRTMKTLNISNIAQEKPLNHAPPILTFVGHQSSKKNNPVTHEMKEKRPKPIRYLFKDPPKIITLVDF